MSMVNYLLGAQQPNLVETNSNFVQYLTDIAAGSHDPLPNATKIVRAGPSLDTDHNFYQYETTLLGSASAVSVQAIMSNHSRSPNGNWSTCGTYLFARGEVGGSRGLCLGMYGADSIRMTCNTLGQVLPHTGNLLASISLAPAAPITSWQALKMAVRSVGEDTQIDVYRHFNVADAAALSWIHSFTVLIRQNLSVQGWAHEAGSFSVGSLNGEALPQWAGTVGWGAGRSGSENADHFTYLADFKAYD